MQTLRAHLDLLSTDLNHQQRACVVLLPGGPAFSSATLRGLAPLAKEFDLVFVDPPGTGGAGPLLPNDTYDSVLEEIESALLKLSRKVILLGHSFGGIQAADLLLRGRLDVSALVCLGTPFSRETFAAIQANMSTEIQAGAARFYISPSDQGFRDWIYLFRDVYFTESAREVGATMLKTDRCSFELFLALSERMNHTEPLLDMLSSFSTPKFSIAGQHDKLVSLENLRKDALRGGFQLHEVKGAQHFMMTDKGAETCQLLARLLAPYA